MAYLINCPHCGKRATDEFYVKGDATKARPTAIGDGTLDQWHDYVNIRENVRGQIAEYWHHTGEVARHALLNAVVNKARISDILWCDLTFQAQYLDDSFEFFSDKAMIFVW